MAKSKKKVAKKAVKKPVTKKPVKKATAKKPAAKKASAKKSVAKKSVAKKAAPKKSPAKKSPAKKATSSLKPAASFAPVKPAKKVNLSGFVTPLDDRVLVHLAEAERRTAGGLYIPNTVSDVSGNLHGVVVSVGRGRRDKKGRVHPMDLQVGDKVVFTGYAGTKIKIEEYDLIFLRESDVLGVVG